MKTDIFLVADAILKNQKQIITVLSSRLVGGTSFSIDNSQLIKTISEAVEGFKEQQHLEIANAILKNQKQIVAVRDSRLVGGETFTIDKDKLIGVISAATDWSAKQTLNEREK